MVEMSNQSHIPYEVGVIHDVCKVPWCECVRVDGVGVGYDFLSLKY